MTDQKTFAIGTVHLIGAGPGDPEDLTLKAVRLLGAADVILIDSLVNRDILKFAKSDAQIIDVGKRHGRISTPQSAISELMIDFARKGLQVARVKSGDPFVFGRGGEELQALHDADVPVTVCSGISSGIAIPDSLGIPLTHRDLSHSFTFITGSRREDERTYNWTSLVESESTLVVFMGLHNLQKIVSNLLRAGKHPGTPSVAVENGTLPNQRAVYATLSALPEMANEANLQSPTLVVIGEVVKLSQSWKVETTHVQGTVARTQDLAAQGGKAKI